MNICGDCKWFSYDVMGGGICTREDGNRKASPYVGACIDNFERKETEQ